MHLIASHSFLPKKLQINTNVKFKNMYITLNFVTEEKRNLFGLHKNTLRNIVHLNKILAFPKNTKFLTNLKLKIFF